MFTTLLESNRRRTRVGAQGVLSLAFHAALGVGAIEATRRVETGPPPVRTIPVVVPPDTPRRVEPAPVQHSQPVLGPSLPDNPVFVPPPVDLQDGIPPADIGEPIDPRRFVVGSPVPRPCQAGCVGTDSTSTTVFREELVDEPATVLTQPAPVYPPLLKAAGIEGRVVLEFVVDTLGAVEPSTVRSLESTHGAFEESARRTVLASRFAPARIRGTAVRQLVRQGVSFRVE